MNRIKHLFILIFDFIGLMIIFSIAIFALNYFKIIPLSAAFPKYFGFLPQKIETISTFMTPAPLPTASALTWDKQANPALISNYSDYFKSHDVPVANPADIVNPFFVTGALTAYNKNYIQIITSQGQGIAVFQITKDSVLRKISPSTTTKNQRNDGISRITEIYKSSADFFNDVPFGAYLQIIYQLNGDIKIASSVDYYPEYKY